MGAGCSSWRDRGRSIVRFFASCRQVLEVSCCLIAGRARDLSEFFRASAFGCSGGATSFRLPVRRDDAGGVEGNGLERLVAGDLMCA